MAACLLAAPCSFAAAPGADPLHSPDCLRARAQLEAALAAPDARGSARLARARRQALQACLGTESAVRQRSGAPDPPQAVARTLSAAPPPAAPSAASALPAPPPPVAIPRAAMVTACDPAGCWDSAGRRLNRMGPLLVGPTGPCQAHGGLVTCP